MIEKKTYRDVQKFLGEVEELCRKHGLMMTASGYDSLQVWPLKEGEKELDFNGFDNRVDGVDLYQGKVHDKE